MKKKWICAVLIGVLAMAGYAGNVLATTGPAVTTTILGRSVFPGFTVSGQSIPPGLWDAAVTTHGISDVYVVDNKFAPGATTGWHSHPGPSMILVVAGSVTNYTSDCTVHTYTAGTGFIDSGGTDVHTLRNQGSVQAETLAVQLLAKDAPRKTKAPEPGNCHF